jgi:hypothetical protein
MMKFADFASLTITRASHAQRGVSTPRWKRRPGAACPLQARMVWAIKAAPSAGFMIRYVYEGVVGSLQM